MKTLLIQEQLNGNFMIWDGYSLQMLQDIPKAVISEFVKDVHDIAKEKGTKFDYRRFSIINELFKEDNK